jgi:D-alanine-D-alanine ligase
MVKERYNRLPMKKNLIGIVHNIPQSGSYQFSKASVDVMTQVASIEKALDELGYSSKRIPLSKDIDAFLAAYREEPVDMVFNLCETIDEDPMFSGHAASVLELIGVPFSGSPSSALTCTMDKAMTKRVLKACGVRTPNYLIYEGSLHFNAGCLAFPVIVKPRFEDASIGIDQESVFGSETTLKKEIGSFYDRFGPLLIEEYIDGREFNVTLFGYPKVDIMPIAEIDFSAFPEDIHRIVGYRAKWDESSFEYNHTPRTYSGDIHPTLKGTMEMIARECFHIFMLRDYGRVDIRTDRRNKPYVLEINANPCISPDAGFAASLEQSGINYTEMVRRLLDFMSHRSD